MWKYSLEPPCSFLILLSIFLDAIYVCVAFELVWRAYFSFMKMSFYELLHKSVLASTIIPRFYVYLRCNWKPSTLFSFRQKSKRASHSKQHSTCFKSMLNALALILSRERKRKWEKWGWEKKEICRMYMHTCHSVGCDNF